MATAAQAYGIDDNTYGAVNHRIAPLETLLVEWANVVSTLGVWPPGNLNAPSDLPVTFPAAHSCRVEATLSVQGTDPGGSDTVTVELLIDGVGAGGPPQTQNIFSGGIFFYFTEPTFTAVPGTGPQLRLTNDSAVFDILIGDVTVEFPSFMDVYDDFTAPAASRRGGFFVAVY